MISKKTISLVLSLMSIGGVGLTSALSVKCSKKVEDGMTKGEKAKCYIPAILSGIGTSACILGIFGVSRKEIAAVTAACSYITANKDAIESKIAEKYGTDALKTVKHEASEKISLTGNRSIERTGRGNLLCYEEYSGRLFYSSMDAVQEAEMKLSERYRNGHRICLNDFYDYLNIEKTTFGNNWGWMPDIRPVEMKFYDDNPLCFDDRLVEDTETGKPVLIITMYNYPSNNWMSDEF